jgi:hypothetical protein
MPSAQSRIGQHASVAPATPVTRPRVISSDDCTKDALSVRSPVARSDAPKRCCSSHQSIGIRQRLRCSHWLPYEMTALPWSYLPRRHVLELR